ncbi:MAG TPA: type II toxin-antitoxin system VapB family antitoxin [Allosphingosinicella sp.]|nr:type II toxin-antitoxin system VapB family antitoxin [Allosphingosinicella sp.]
MNIKNAEAAAIAAELAKMEGTSVTQVVLEALRARKRELSKEEKVARVMAIARDMRARMSPELLALDIDDYLYDENGLPK